MKKLLTFDFLPRNADAALLVARVWFGLSIALLHGWGKVTSLAHGHVMFNKPILGIGAGVEFTLIAFAEFVCALLVVLGLWTRLAALFVVIGMGVAFVKVHGLQLSGPMSGEMAFLYCAAFFTILVGGPGKFSVDGK